MNSVNGAIRDIGSQALFEEIRLEILANNLANIDTSGFKRDKATFRVPDAGDNTAKKPQMNSSNNAGFSMGTITDYSAGVIKVTDNSLDVAINGDGFFSVQTPEGVKYTRSGSFSLNQDKVLVTQQGLPVLGRRGEIKIDGNVIKIDEKGNISVDGTQTDTLQVVDFSHPYQLSKSSGTMFTPNKPEEINPKPQNFEVKQGFLEMSNVEGVQAMTEMIDVLRGYESYQKAIRSLNDITTKAINEVGKTA